MNPRLFEAVALLERWVCSPRKPPLNTISGANLNRDTRKFLARVRAAKVVAK